jgi:LysM repeat protein
VDRADWRRYVAPVAFLVAATIAVVLVRAGLESGASRPATTPTIATTKAARRYFTVRAGDTLTTISRKTHVPVRMIRKLNPKLRPTLFIGQKVRIR